MHTQTALRAGDWIDGRTLIADVHAGQVDVITLTEAGETREMAEKQAHRLQQRRRHRQAQSVLRQRLRGMCDPPC